MTGAHNDPAQDDPAQDDPAQDGAAQDDQGLETLLRHLRDTRGFDFTGYKRSSLSRRVRRRMEQVGITDHAEYLDHLELHGDEFTALFNTILINVTGFFRDPEAWEQLRGEVLPELLAAKGPADPIRVWSAGCASGEEAYTLAMVLAELLGDEAFRARVKIYATDVDEDALAHARQAVYDERQMASVPPELRERYFEPVGGRHGFRADLRRSVIFGRNDLVQDAPISRIDVLACRNALMYLDAETQARILARFHFALAPAGVLFLGKAEMLLSHGARFAPVDLRRRIFRRTAQPPPGATSPAWPSPATSGADGGTERMREALTASGAVAELVLTPDGVVAMVNRQAETLLGLSRDERGRLFRDLDVSYRPAELRRPVEVAQAERRTVVLDDVTLARGEDGPLTLEIRVRPLLDDEGGRPGEVLGVAIAFHDVTEPRRLAEELRHTASQLDTAYEELQSTNEELETTNEELHSTVEELETTNEELQSTNEELETMNEELQSTNDELKAINDELGDRTGQLDEANGFLESVLRGLQHGVVVLGPDLAVRAWNQQAQELWGLRRDEAVGVNFLALDIGLPIDLLRPMIRRALTGDGEPQELGVVAVNRRGRTIGVRVLGSTLGSRDDAAAGVILMMEGNPDGPTVGSTPARQPARPDDEPQD